MVERRLDDVRLDAEVAEHRCPRAAEVVARPPPGAGLRHEPLRLAVPVRQSPLPAAPGRRAEHHVDRITDLTAADFLDWKADAAEFTDLRGADFDGSASLGAALDAAAASGFDTDGAVEAFLFRYLGVTYAAVEDVAANPGLDFDQGADLVVRLEGFSAAAALTQANFI